jgi:hypothetical protein
MGKPIPTEIGFTNQYLDLWKQMSLKK